MPRWVEYFCDPMWCIQKFTACHLNECKRQSKVKGYALGTTYEEAFGVPLHGAHNSKIDAEGQQKLCANELVKPFLDKVPSVLEIDKVWKGKRARQAVMEEEPTRALPLGWDDCPSTGFPIPANLRYTGANGGGMCGPSSRVTEACNSRNLADLFLFFFTVPMLSTIAKEMNRYGNETFVREVGKDEWRAQEDDIASAEVEAVDEENGEEDNNDAHEVDPESGRFLYERYMYGGDDADYDSSDDSDYESEEDDEDDEDEDGPRRKRYFVECEPEHPNARKRAWKGEWIPVTPGMLLVFFGIMIVVM
jgi:hypothetical protein